MERTKLAAYLKEYKDVFAWTHVDMPWIDLEIMVHRLHDDTKIQEKVQARMSFNPKRYLAINEEVDNLLAADFIREAKFPKWIENTVTVKNLNGKLRICIDYSNLDKACPKGCVLLPRITNS